jgi:hypothetical protein
LRRGSARCAAATSTILDLGEAWLTPALLDGRWMVRAHVEGLWADAAGGDPRLTGGLE